MALKDIWVDKKDGVDVVRAKDINDIASAIIDIENDMKNDDKDSFAQTLDGNEEDKAPSVRAVNGGLNGKVDKITKIWQAYTTDDNGNTVPKKLAAKPAAGGVVLYNEGGIVKTNAPVEDLDCVNKKTMDDGLAGKFSLPSTLDSWCLLGIGDYNKETGEYTPNRFTRNAVGTGKNFVATFSLATDANSFNKSADYIDKALYTLGGADPIYPVQYANKRYVDNKYRDLQQGVYNAIGVQYITVEDTSTSDFSQIPAGAMPFAYFESLGDIVVYGHDGKVIDGGAEVVGIQLIGDPGEEISIDPNTVPTFFEIPNGYTTIMLNLRIQAAIDGLMSYFEIKGKKIIYQVKVGA